MVIRKLKASVVSDVTAKMTRLAPASPKRSRPISSRMVKALISGTIMDSRREFVLTMTDFSVLPAAAFSNVQHSRLKSSSGALGSAEGSHSKAPPLGALKLRRARFPSGFSGVRRMSVVPSRTSRIRSSKGLAKLSSSSLAWARLKSVMSPSRLRSASGQ